MILSFMSDIWFIYPSKNIFWTCFINRRQGYVICVMLVNSGTLKTPSTPLPNADFLRQNRILKGKPIILVCCVGIPMPLIAVSLVEIKA